MLVNKVGYDVGKGPKEHVGTVTTRLSLNYHEPMFVKQGFVRNVKTLLSLSKSIPFYISYYCTAITKCSS